MQAGVLPSGEAVCSLPNTLVALCLNNAGMERVRQTKALSCFVTIFTSKAYIKALQGDTPPALGAGLDELLRHVSSLRKEGVGMIVDILKRLCNMGGRSNTWCCRQVDSTACSFATFLRLVIQGLVCTARIECTRARLMLDL